MPTLRLSDRSNNASSAVLSFADTKTPIPDLTNLREFTPFHFQEEDIAYLATRPNGCSANFSEMGCAKTTTLEWLIQKKLRGKLKLGAYVLIITTRTGKTTYFETLPSLLPGVPYYNVTADTLPYNAKKPGIYIAHYDLFRNGSRIGERLREFKWDFLALDEAHRIKNPGAQATRNIKKIKARYKHAMTGTGFINRPDEVWSILHFLDREHYRSHHNFKQRYCQMEVDWDNGFERVVGVLPHMEEEFKEMLFAMGVRRTKREVFHDMPERLYQRINVELNPQQRKMYNEVAMQLRTMDVEGMEIPTPSVLSQLTRMRQIAVATPKVTSDGFDSYTQRRLIKLELTEPSSKIDAVMELVEGASEPMVIYSQFRDTVELIKKRLSESKPPVSYIHLASEDSDEVRYEKVQRFQQGDIQVFVSTMGVGSESITLTAADSVVLVDRSWSPKDNEQAIARVHRPGQTSTVQVYYIEAEDTVDQYMEEVLQTKDKWFRMIFGGDARVFING
ncbi:MAG TPA: DEAD/DEAH box helicase [Candidatus Saccharimonadales bacterium]|nr:DEAD/DEAH box helicase [Candidatus Saccharimonadales bacterium]